MNLGLFSQAFRDYNVSKLNLNTNIDASDTSYVLLSPLGLSSSLTFTLPPTVGTNGQFLTSLGTGSLTWTSLSVGSSNPGGSDRQIQYNNSSAFGGASGFIWEADGQLAVGQPSANYLVDVDGTVQIGGEGTSGQLRIFSDQGGIDYELVFNPSNAMTQSTTYTWPNSDGPAGDILVTDGDGNLYWTTDGVTGSFPCNGQGTGGGSGNVADGTDTFVGGGSGNVATSDGENSTIGGGTSNSTSGDRSSILGGNNNTTGINATNSTIGVGENNTVNGANSIIGGGANNTIANGADQNFIGSGSNNYINSDNCAIPGGSSNTIESNSNQSIIGSGFENYIIDSEDSGIFTGQENEINNAIRSSIAGGRENTIESDADNSFIGSGNLNSVSNPSNRGDFTSAVAGGLSNSVSDRYSAIVGGRDNSVSSQYSMAFGREAEVSSDYGLAIGRRAVVDNAGSFAFADGNDQELNTSANSRFEMRFSGGYRFYTNLALTTGAFMNSGDNSWSSFSDSTKKENILKLNYNLFLQKITDLDISTWNYKDFTESHQRNYGPMAQDFYRLFGQDKFGNFGSDTTVIFNHLPAVGLAALKGLMGELEESEKEINELQSEKAKIEAEIMAIEKRIIELEMKFDE